MKTFLFLVLMTMAGCSNSPVLVETKLDSSINGKNITFPPNQKFSLELDLHADGGYQWFCEISNTNLVKMDSDPVYRPKDDRKGLVGGLTIETFYFRTKQVGHCAIKLIEKRIWEKDILPIRTIHFDISIK